MENELSDNNDLLLTTNTHTITEGLFGNKNAVQVELSVSFANYMNQIGVSSSNYLIFMKLIETNNQWIIEALFKKREPRLVFTVIKPSSAMIAKAFQLLACWHPGEIYSKGLMALLGIIANSYHKPDDGYRIYNIDITDLNNIGKYLDRDAGSGSELNSILLEILDRFTSLGLYQASLDKRMLARHAFDIRIAFFDNTKSLIDVIPEVLLVKINRKEREIRPSELFISYYKKMIKN